MRIDLADPLGLQQIMVDLELTTSLNSASQQEETISYKTQDYALHSAWTYYFAISKSHTVTRTDRCGPIEPDPEG